MFETLENLSKPQLVSAVHLSLRFITHRVSSERRQSIAKSMAQQEKGQYINAALKALKEIEEHEGKSIEAIRAAKADSYATKLYKLVDRRLRAEIVTSPKESEARLQELNLKYAPVTLQAIKLNTRRETPPSEVKTKQTPARTASNATTQSRSSKRASGGRGNS